jgi:proteasome lid subunit RPN8/RPN11
MYFDIDSMKFEAAMRRGEAEGRPVKVLYHSHLDVGAYFSATDAEVAKMGRSEPPWDLAYLVTSVRQGQIDDHKLFVWDPGSGAFVESRLEVEGIT